MTHIDSLLGAALGAPALPGAKCRRRHRLFDEPAADEPVEQVRQRHGMALRLCGSCPARPACQDWLDRLAPRDRPYGVVAGQVRTRVHQPTTTSTELEKP